MYRVDAGEGERERERACVRRHECAREKDNEKECEKDEKERRLRV